MVELFATLYSVMQAIAVIMAWPQIRKLYMAKQSNELSLTTWSVWLFSSMITISYASLTENYIWLTANIAWALLYATMVILIVRYRRETIYAQITNLFRLRFYFAIGKAESAPNHPIKKFFKKFKRDKS